MIQLWVIPETPDQPAAYQVFQAPPVGRIRVYGGPPDQDETLAARTVIEIAHLAAGKGVKLPGRSVVYMTVGKGTIGDETIKEGDLVETKDFNFKALTDCKLILVHEK